MITGKDIYHILSAIVPLYVAMILGYASIRWWKIFTPEQSGSISRYVAMFAIPTLTFNFISPINPYHLNFKFIAADSLQKVVILVALFLWNIFTKRGGIDWTITLFSLSTLPNTLLVGVPLLNSMYGEFTTSVSISVVLMQSLVWYNILLIFYEYRAAKLLISQQFHQGSIRSTSKVGIKPIMNVDLEMGENRILDVHDSVTKSHSLPIYDGHGVEMYSRDQRNSLQNVGLEEKIQHKKSFWRSKSCTDVRVFSTEFGTIFDSPNNVKLPKDTSKGVHEFTKWEVNIEEGIASKEQQEPHPHSMTKLIISKVSKKLMKNANIYAALFGLTWSLIASRWNLKMPEIIDSSITIISKTGLGMAMFSLGIFAALQPKIIACGKTVAAISMAIKFLVGPAVMAASTSAIGIRGVLLQAAIVQAAISEGIVPFVFANEYNLHADILSTAVIFGLIIALPVTIVYYILLGL